MKRRTARRHGMAHVFDLVVARWATLVIGASVLAALGPTCARATPVEPSGRARLAGLRLPFIANDGQADARVAFSAPTLAGTLFVTRQGDLVYSLPAPGSGARHGLRATASRPGWTLTETLRGRRARPVGQDPSATGVSYFVGNDRARRRSRAATYDQLGMGEVWPGVAVSLRARGRSIEKVFTVRPGASVARIRVRVGGARALAVNADGALVARTGLGPVTFTAPVAYQERDGVRCPVAVAYRLTGREYGFIVAGYDPTLSLVIDPLLQATYLGGKDDDAASALLIHPRTGDVYIAGGTLSTCFPHTTGGPQPAIGGKQDMFLARLNSSLTSVTQATYLGGSGRDSLDNDLTPGSGLAIHPATGDVYVAGATDSTDFPHTAGGAQTTNVGGLDAFVARLNSALTSVIQATCLGDEGTDAGTAVAIHPMTGDVYVGGATASSHFPGTFGGAQEDGGGVVGDAFVARLTRTLASVIQSTYLGGEAFDAALALAIHPATGDVYAAGETFSVDFPHTNGGAQPTSGGASDAFVARLTFGLAQVDPTLGLSASVNQPTFSVGQTLLAGGAVTDPGLPAAADFYLGLLRPDGSIQFFTGAGIVLGNVTDGSSFRPLAVGIPLGTPFAVTVPTFFTHQWTAGDLHGSHVFFLGAVKTGGGPLIGLATAPFSLP